MNLIECSPPAEVMYMLKHRRTGKYYRNKNGNTYLYKSRKTLLGMLRKNYKQYGGIQPSEFQIVEFIISERK